MVGRVERGWSFLGRQEDDGTTRTPVAPTRVRGVGNLVAHAWKRTQLATKCSTRLNSTAQITSSISEAGANADAAEVIPEEKTVEDDAGWQTNAAPFSAASVPADGEDEDGYMHVSYSDVPRKI
jgi:hypothetical protein